MRPSPIAMRTAPSPVSTRIDAFQNRACKRNSPSAFARAVRRDQSIRVMQRPPVPSIGRGRCAVIAVRRWSFRPFGAIHKQRLASLRLYDYRGGMRLHLGLVLLSLLAAGATARAEDTRAVEEGAETMTVYRHVGADGVVAFSDRASNGAQKVEVPVSSP